MRFECFYYIARCAVIFLSSSARLHARNNGKYFQLQLSIYIEFEFEFKFSVWIEFRRERDINMQYGFDSNKFRWHILSSVVRVVIFAKTKNKYSATNYFAAFHDWCWSIKSWEWTDSFYVAVVSTILWQILFVNLSCNMDGSANECTELRFK